MVYGKYTTFGFSSDKKYGLEYEAMHKVCTMYGVNTIAVFLLALISMILAVNYFISIGRMYTKIKEGYDKIERKLHSKSEVLVNTC